MYSIGPLFFARRALAATDQLLTRFETFRGAKNKQLALNPHTIGDLEESKYSNASRKALAVVVDQVSAALGEGGA